MKTIDTLLSLAILTLLVRPASAAPDLVATAFTAPAGIATGQAFMVSGTIENQGDATASPAWIDEVYLSTDASLGPGDSPLGPITSPSSVPPGGSYNPSNTYTLPGGTPAGSYYLILKADAVNSVSEASEGNNSFAVPITVQKPDLVATAFSAPAGVATGQPFMVTGTIENQGDATASPAWIDEVYLSTDASLGPGDSPLGPITSPSSVPPGGSYNPSNTYTLPGSTPAGSYYLILKADAVNSVPEASEGNNTFAVPFTVQKPDLVATAFSAPAGVVAGQPFMVSGTIENQGDATASPAWIDEVYLSTDASLGPGDSPLGPITSPSSLPPGGSYNPANTYTLPGSTPAGSYYLILKADAVNSVPEASEGNNSFAVPISVVLPTSTPTNTATETPTNTPTPSNTPTPTSTRTPTNTNTATSTATPTATSTSAVAACAATPRNDCVSAPSSLLKVFDNIDPNKRKLVWRWSLGNLDLVEVGDPVNQTANYALCVYDDGVLEMSPAIAAGGTCGTRPCWKLTRTGPVYTNAVGNAAGITKVKLKGGIGSALIKVKGKGGNLAMPFPVTDTIALTVQFVRNPGAATECWEAVLPAPPLLNDGVKLKDKIP